MRKRTIPSALLLLCILFLFVADQGIRIDFSMHISMFLHSSILISESEICSLGQKFQANAEDNSDELVDPPKVEDKIGAVPQGLSTDSDVAKRYISLNL